ncbi:MBOAT-domain-containing protein [Schizopora paradoxa]|uniref:MBOAT-domain-containing protein n=1 Tax=Schizopora paradoxa TaxID=27342 RepID=A0A0H2RF12_9AGAM|nr:MBOAT-domain-containing protein [Schizopora paradoxa]
MDALFVPLANVVGASVDQVKLITCLLVAYPLGSVFVRIPSQHQWAKHLFNISITFFLTCVVLGLWTGFLQLLGSTVATYVIAKSMTGWRMPWVVFVVVMGHLTVNHVIRAIFQWSYEKIEVTSPQMVLTMKLTTFAWNVYDGRRPVAELDKWQSEKRITQYPSLLAFLGYAFYFPGFLVGPYLDYASYASLIDESVFKKAEKGDVNEKKDSGASALSQKARRLLPDGRKRVAYRKLLTGLVFLGLYVTQIGTFSFEEALKDWFTTKSLLYRIVFFQICGFFERSKYYAIWTLTEGASIVTGNGFTGYGPRGESLWNDAANVDVLNIELGPNFKVLLDSWNMKTNVWLRECVYKRVTPKGKKPGFRSGMITFMTSAFWHGVAGGYYLAFFFGGFIQTAGRLCRSNLRPLLLPADYNPKTSGKLPSPSLAKRLYDVVGIACTVLLTNYTAAPFMLLSIRSSLQGWGALGWYGHVMIVGSFAFFYGGGAAWCQGLQKRRVKAAGVTTNGHGHKTGNGTTPVTPGAGVLPPVDLAVKREL